MNRNMMKQAQKQLAQLQKIQEELETIAWLFGRVGETLALHTDLDPLLDESLLCDRFVLVASEAALPALSTSVGSVAQVVGKCPRLGIAV